MKLQELFEMLDKSYVENVKWTDYKDGSWGVFDYQELRFVIDIKFESLTMMKEKYNFEELYDLPDSMFENKKIARINYTQIVDGEHRYDTTGNVGKDAIKIAIESADKLKPDKCDVIYFAAKSHEDNSKNVRLTLYPRLGEIMSKRLNMICLVDKSTDTTLTMLLKGFTSEELIKLRHQIQ
jgi:hypothetical protein